MYEFIPSEYYRNFCCENNIKFTERESATIIWNDRDMPLKQKLAELDKAAAESSDAAFKQTIDIVIKNKQRILASICSSKSGYIFLNDVDNVPFDEFEAARKYCKTANPKTEYCIDKYRVLSSGDDKADFKSQYCGGVHINADGEIIGAWDNEVEFPSEYTNCFIPFANPFEHGDIVRDCCSGKIGVVETSQDEWNDFLKRNENNKAYDFSDAALIIQILSDDGFTHEHIQPIYLEKLPLNEKGIPKCFDTKNNIKDDLITCVSELMRGEIQLDIFMSIFLEWREEQVYKQVQSRSWRG